MHLDQAQWSVVDIGDATQVGAARRLAARIAEGAGLDETAAGQLGLVVVELATNLLKHAVRGSLYLRIATPGAADVIALDHGPGMDLERCFSDGFSTGGTSGTGLGAVRRAASVFDAYSDVKGSVLFARIGVVSGPRRGSLAVAVGGELESGDSWQFIETDDGWSIAVADGLGHGAGAAAAVRPVLEAHRSAPDDPGRCLTEGHRRSHGTRGAACSVVALKGEPPMLVHAGIGNVSVSIVGPHDSRGFPSQNGTLGVACPPVRENRLDIPSRGLLILHSDGLSARWSLDNYAGLRGRHPQVVAGALFRDARRPRDDATIMVVELGGTR
jgi:anti-sigma regulatory factor (Ser/Thr protein kinase)